MVIYLPKLLPTLKYIFHETNQLVAVNNNLQELEASLGSIANLQYLSAEHSLL